MPDGEFSITERATRQFTEQYLAALDANVVYEGDCARVTLSDGVKTELDIDNTTLVFGAESESTEAHDGSVLVSPESEFFQQMIDEAATAKPVGSLRLTSVNTPITLPSWLTESQVMIKDAEFTPYYDREAICVLFHIGIETVSEYQSELLRPIAVDLRTADFLPGVAESYLRATDLDQPTLPSASVDVDHDSVGAAIEVARREAEAQIKPVVEEIRQKASRAADFELDEYRQLQRQRIEEYEVDIESYDRRLEELQQTIRHNNRHQARVEALQERKRIQDEREQFAEQQEELLAEDDAGFPEKRREIRDRHALRVTIEPVILTLVVYEKGELDVTIRNQSNTQTLTLSYGAGVGYTDTATCDTCGEPLDDNNPVSVVDGSIYRGTCCSISSQDREDVSSK